ncbi:hypothetical protein FQA39_LY00578 [Lamprigera yunnana]|nr:hypothetical protein FQA39_LY00578 [Lamprigera yunnana]
MPTNYKRTISCFRASWTKEQLTEAIQAINENKMGVNEAARNFGVCNCTVKSRNKVHTMDKKRYYFDNPADVEKLRHLAYEEMDELMVLPDENLNESDDSETEDRIETRTIGSDTDHDVDDEDECKENKEAGYYIGK